MRISSAALLLALLPLPMAPASEAPDALQPVPQPQSSEAPAPPAAVPPAGSPSAAPSSNAAGDLPKDTGKPWVVAFSALSARGMSPENAYLAFSIPLLLRDRVSGLPSHTFSEEDRLIYASGVIAAELRSVSQSLTLLRQDRDSLLFSYPPTTADARDAANKKLQGGLDRQQFLRFLDPADISFPLEKPLTFKDGPGAGRLFDAPRYSPLAFARQQGIDLLVGGSIAEVQGYILLDLWACETSKETVAFTFRDASRRESLYGALNGATSDLTRLLLGREWASLTVIPDPPGSVTEVDGKRVGAGRITSLYLTPGTRELRVTAPGYKEKVLTVDLPASEERTVPVTLEKVAVPSITLTSDPPGADVYADSVWTGRTPLLLPRPADRKRVQLVSHGFYDQPLSVGPTSPREITVPLLPDKGSREARQNKARDDFYTSFAFFALSLPIPFFCYSIAQDEANEISALRGSPGNTFAAQEASYVTGNVFYYSYLGGLGVSGGLFIWMAVNLFTYVTAATRTAG